MKFYITVFLFFLSSYSYSQTQISGKVVDEVTKQGIMDVSVYINNTTFGAKTDKNGDFFFYSPIGGNADIVVSHINYNKIIQPVNLSANQKLNLSLKQKETNLNEVVIAMPKLQSDEDKTKWFKLFYLNLIGVYGYGSKVCKIVNPEVLKYRYNANTKDLFVSANSTIEIENLFLGYKINLDLENFQYNFLTNEVSYKYTSLYENLKNNKFKDSEIKTNRNKAYLGSTMHFMRALYSNRLVNEGFEVYKYLTGVNVEKKRISGIILKAIADKYETERNPDVLLNKLFPKDTALYYSSVMKQLDAKSFEAKEIGALELTTKNRLSRTVNFNFADTLRIVYKIYSTGTSKKPEVAIRAYGGLKIKKDPNDDIPPLTTYLYFFETGGVNIENTGYYPDFRLFMYGDMAERRIANALPYDFEPIPISGH